MGAMEMPRRSWERPLMARSCAQSVEKFATLRGSRCHRGKAHKVWRPVAPYVRDPLTAVSTSRAGLVPWRNLRGDEALHAGRLVELTEAEL